MSARVVTVALMVLLVIVAWVVGYACGGVLADRRLSGDVVPASVFRRAVFMNAPTGPCSDTVWLDPVEQDGGAP